MARNMTVDIDIEIANKQRLLAERNHLYRKLNTIGYVPDVDMRHKINEIRVDLEKRIESLCENLVEIGG